MTDLSKLYLHCTRLNQMVKQIDNIDMWFGVSTYKNRLL